MSTTIDQKVVEMRFDNRQFESNVQTTMSTLDKLKQKLNLNGAAKGLESVDKAARNVNMSGLGSAVEAVSAKFSSLQVMGVTALANITNSAINAGKRIVSALTIDPVKSGFQEYETQIDAVQTILANTQSKGTTLNDVNKALDMLNAYADKTIYNFTEMTRNIGTFTAAGVDLDTSVNAIQGIANLAAVSGSTSQQASTAMYQLSQALSSGTVKLGDWNSVVNAGMGGQVFQDALKETARVHGIAIDDMIKSQGSFRETLSEGWLTSEILTETLQHFTLTTEGLTDAQIEQNREMLRSKGYTEEQIDEIFKLGDTATQAATKVKTFTQLFDTLKEAVQSGWTQSWEIIIGDFEEAKELLTGISDTLGTMIGKSAESRNAMLQGWKDLGGRTALIDSIRNVFEGLMSIMAPIGEAFREIFPPMTSERLFKITETIRDLTSKLKISEETANKVKNVFRGLFSVLGFGIDVVKTILKTIVSFAGGFGNLAGTVLSAASAVGEFIYNIRNGIKTSEKFSNVGDKISEGVGKASTAISNFASYCLENFGPAMEFLWGIFKKVGSKVAEVASVIATGFRDALSSGDIESFMNILNGGILATLLLNIKKFIKNFTDKIKTNAKGILYPIKQMFGNASAILDSVRKSLEVWQANLKASVLLKIAAAIGILTVSLIALSGIDPDKMSSALGAMTLMFVELAIVTSTLSKLNGTLRSSASAALSMIGMAIAISILAGAIKKISNLDSDQLETGLVGIGVAMTMVVASAKVLSTNNGVLIKGATGLIAFAFSIKILAEACVILSDLSWNELKRGLTGVGVLIAEIGVFFRTLKPLKGIFTSAIGIVILAGAIKVLETTCQNFSKMSWEEITKGLVGLGGILLELSGFSRLVDTKGIIRTSMALTIIGACLHVVLPVFQDLSKMSWSSIMKALVSIGGTFAILALTARSFPKDDIMEMSASVPVVTSALTPLAAALTTIGSLSWDQVARGLVAIGVSMAVLSKGLNSMKHTLKASMALVVAAGAIFVIASAFSVLGGLGVVGMAASIAAMASAFLVLGIAAKTIAPLASRLVKLSLSILSLSLSFTAMGASFAAVGTGLTMLVTSFMSVIMMFKLVSIEDLMKGILGLAGVFVVLWGAAILLKPLTGTLLKVSGSIALLGLSCAAVAISISLIATALLGLAAAGEAGAKTIVESLKILIVGFLEIIPTIVTQIVEAAKSLILAFVDALVTCIPILADGFMKVIVGTLKSLVQYTPQIVSLLIDFLIKVINGIAEKLPELIDAAVNLIGKLFEGIFDAMSNIDPDAAIKAVLAVGGISALIWALSSVAAMVPGAMLGVLGVGAVIAELSLVLAAIGGLAQIPGLKWLVDEGGNFLESIGIAIGKLIGGLVGGAVSGFTSSLSKIAEDLSSFMEKIQPFIDGVKTIDKSAVDGAMSLVGLMAVMAGENVLDFLSRLLTFGRSPMETFKENALAFVETMCEISDKLSSEGNSINIDLVDKVADAGEIFIALANSIPATSGIKTWWSKSDLKTFGESAKGFVEAMVDAMRSLNTEGVVIDTAKVSMVTQMGYMFTALNNVIPATSGIKTWWSKSDLGKFGESAQAFVEAIVDSLNALNEEGVDVNTAKISQVTQMGYFFTGLYNAIPENSGIKTWWSSTDMTSFGVSAKNFVSCMIDVCNALNAEGVVIDTAKTAMVTQMGYFFTGLYNAVPENSGIKSLWSSTDLTSFGGSAIDFVSCMIDVCKALNTEDVVIDTAKTSMVTQMGYFFSRLYESVPENTGIKTLWSSSDLETFGESAKGFVEEMIDVCNALNEDGVVIDNNKVSQVTQMGYFFTGLCNTLSANVGIKSIWSSSDLKTFGESARGFVEEMVDICNALNEEGVVIDTSKVSMVTQMGYFFTGLVNALPENTGIKTWWSKSDLEKFGESAKGFVSSMVDICDALNAEDVVVDTSKVSMVTQMGYFFARLYDAVPENTGIKTLWSSTDLGKFGESTKAFVASMVDISNELSKETVVIDTAKTSMVTQMGYMFSALNNAISDNSGIKSIWSSSDLKTFGESAQGFIEAMIDASNSLNAEDVTINEDAIGKAVRSGELMAALQDAIPTDKWFDGKVQIDDFGAKIKSFGEYLVEFSSKVSEMDFGKSSSAITQAYKLGRLAQDLVDLDTSGIENFDDASNIGEAISDYYEKVEDIDTSVISSSIESADKLKDLISKLVDLDTSGISKFQVSVIGTAMKNYSNCINGIDTSKVSSSVSSATNLKNLIDDLSGIDTSGVNSFKTALDTLATVQIDKFAEAFESAGPKLSSSGKKIVDFLTNGVTSGSPKVIKAATNILNQLYRSFASKASSFMMLGSMFMTKLATGIMSKSSSVGSAVSALLGAAVSRILGYYSNFYNSGTYVGTGLVRGILAKQRDAYNAGFKLGQKAIQGERDGQKSHSPSKLAIQSGEWIGEGLIIGMDSLAAKVYKTGYSLGDTAAKSISSTVAKISDYVTNSVDSTPTIRPVLDLSDVESGVGLLDGMFGNDFSVGAVGRVNAISSSMNGALQNGANDDIISAIKNLGKTLGGRTGDTYNVNGVTYDDGSNVSNAVESLVRAVRIGKRV